MGAWDIGSFANDDALDWLLELQDEDELGLLEDAFVTVIDQKGEFPDASDSAVAVAAGEVLAALVGNPLDELPPEVGDWVVGKDAPKDGLMKLAQEALGVVLAESELKALWEEVDEYPDWVKDVESLAERLS
jgi:hypothetical protein